MTERALRTVLYTFGLLFFSAIFPLFNLRGNEALQMMLSIYVTLGVFLLMAAQNPAGKWSLITFAAWANLAHGTVMAALALGSPGERLHLLGGAALVIAIGLTLLALRATENGAARAARR